MKLFYLVIAVGLAVWYVLTHPRSTADQTASESNPESQIGTQSRAIADPIAPMSLRTNPTIFQGRATNLGSTGYGSLETIINKFRLVK